MKTKEILIKSKRKYTDEKNWELCRCQWCDIIFIPNRRYQKFCCSNHAAYASRVRIYGSLKNYYKSNYKNTKIWRKEHRQQQVDKRREWRHRHDAN